MRRLTSHEKSAAFLPDSHYNYNYFSHTAFEHKYKDARKFSDTEWRVAHRGLRLNLEHQISDLCLIFIPSVA